MGVVGDVIKVAEGLVQELICRKMSLGSLGMVGMPGLEWSKFD